MMWKTTEPKAQSLVEFSLILPLLLLMMVLMIDLGFLFYSQVVVTNAAWEGARTGATLQESEGGDQRITSAVIQAAYGLDPDRLVIEIDPREDEYPRNQAYPAPRGEDLKVLVEYRMRLNLLSRSIPVTGKAVTRMEYQNP